MVSQLEDIDEILTSHREPSISRYASNTLTTKLIRYKNVKENGNNASRITNTLITNHTLVTTAT